MNYQDFLELMRKGGPTMWPLLLLSVLSFGTILERLWFWIRLMTKEKEIVEKILEAAQRNWDYAEDVARQVRRQPIGRFLYAALRLKNPDPELFKLALEASADEELAAMRKGDKTLEAIIALSPLLGLLGTVLGLIHSLKNIKLGDLGTSSTAGVTEGIGESLISTATGLIIAITTLAFFRLFQGLLFNQVKIFRRAGNELELMYRQDYPQIHLKRGAALANLPGGKPKEGKNRFRENEPNPRQYNEDFDRNDDNNEEKKPRNDFF